MEIEGREEKKRNDESIEAILFFFVHRMQNPRISSFVTPFLPISVFGFRVGNILSQPFQAIPQEQGFDILTPPGLFTAEFTSLFIE